MEGNIAGALLSIFVLCVAAGMVLQIVATVWRWKEAPNYGERFIGRALLSRCFNFVWVVAIYYFCFRLQGKIRCRHYGIWFKPVGKIALLAKRSYTDRTIYEPAAQMAF